MTERLREQLSALMDGDAVSESSVSEFLGNPELKATWARYHLVRDALHNELSFPAGDLASRVSAALDAEPTVLAPRAKKAFVIPGFFRQAASFAVAASVTAAVIFGVQTYQGRDIQQPALAQQGAPNGAPVVQQPSMLMVAPMVQAASARSSGAKSPDPRQERLRAYLLDHSQQAAARGESGMLPYVKAVSHESEER